jgi:hypothetical protein
MIIPDWVGASTRSTLRVDTIEMSESRTDCEWPSSCVALEIGNTLRFKFSGKILFVQGSSDALSRVRLLANDEGLDLLPPFRVVNQELRDLSSSVPRFMQGN